jgi:dihydrofolate synthase/folylpolyglutamate synthase
MNEKYLGVLKRLYTTNKFRRKKVDLINIQKACDLMNNPEKAGNYIHITGTNGKGSTCLKLASTFQKANIKTGLFTSPHITTFRERIKINNEMISKEYIVEELERIYKMNDEYNLDLTFFELVTLLGFNYYRDMRVDLVVLEVGMGGNLDATNIVDPLLSIITSIGMDHMDNLGFTQREIAEKKAGIIKSGKPALIGIDCNPEDVFETRVSQTNSKLYKLKDCLSSKNEGDFFNDMFRKYFTNIDLFNRDFEKENSLTVLKAVQILKDIYPEYFSNVSTEDYEYGILQKQPCRLEDYFSMVPNSRKDFPEKIHKIFLDVAHNTHAMQKLLPNIRHTYPNTNLFIIAGFSANKEKHDLFKAVSQYADKIYLTSTDHPRLLKCDEIDSQFKQFMNCGLYQHAGLYQGAYNINQAILKAKECAIKNDRKSIIVICGSFFIMKDARKCLAYNEEEDPVELNEINPLKFNC